MKTKRTIKLLFLSLCALPSVAYVNVKPTFRPQRRSLLYSSTSPSEMLETSPPVTPDTTTTTTVIDMQRSTFKVEKLVGAVVALAIAGNLLLSHFDASLAHHHHHGTALALSHVVHAGGQQAWQSYNHVLATHPVVTKAVTSAVVYSLGDAIAQKSEKGGTAELDVARILRSGLAGGLGHGPLSHVWYNLSEDFFNNVVHWTAWWSFLPKIVVDQTVWGPLWTMLYIILLGSMKQEPLEKMVGDVKSSTIPLVLDGLKLWPLAHCVTYGLIPVENRLLWVDLVEIAWVTILANKAASLSVVNEEESNDINTEGTKSLSTAQI